MPGAFNENIADTFDMSDAYRLASTVKPVKAKDLKKAYRPYDRTGSKLKVGGKQHKSDKQLYKLATTEVIEWWKHKQAMKRKRKKGRVQNPGGRRASSSGRVSAAPSGTAGTRGAMLPDTAMPAPGSTRVTRATKLPDIRSPRPVRSRVTTSGKTDQILKHLLETF